MYITDVIDCVTLSILRYYSLIREFDITERLVYDVKSSLMIMWYNISEYQYNDNIMSVNILYGPYYKQYENLNDLYENIDNDLTSYLNSIDLLSNTTHIISLCPIPFVGMSLTHLDITRIIEFNLNYYI